MPPDGNRTQVSAHSVLGCLGPTVGVGFKDEWSSQVTEGTTDALPAAYVSAERVLIAAVRRPNLNLNQDLSMRGGALVSPQMDVSQYPGDTITTIRPSTEERTERVVCVLHASPVRAMLGRAPERLLWFNVDTSKIETLCATNVIGMVLFTDEAKKMEELYRHRLSSKNSGKLNTGNASLCTGRRYTPIFSAEQELEAIKVSRRDLHPSTGASQFGAYIATFSSSSLHHTARCVS